ncbi:hypothetical protein L4X63_21500 [Geomonas sp. Red32]|uniref:MBG domain-containing protein n=1 Tax=Geomonas sp. Red32 TaxID=2912856 RepID=UPI00202CA738|nr:MBG domain-containing protein [Geomonas sp. Red32]MCM0084162.1 hypothetical protein [Geomonas sp. Red32]
MGRWVVAFLIAACMLLPASGEGASLYLDGFRIYSSGTVNLTPNGSSGTVRAIAVQPWDGKVIIGGSFVATGGSPAKTFRNLARLNTDGTIDPGFDVSTDGPVNAVTLQLDQGAPPQPAGILVGGSFSTVTTAADGTLTRHGLARLATNGSLDPSFDPSEAGAVVNVIRVDTVSGGILVGGTFTSMTGMIPPQTCSNLARIAATDGAFLNGFSGGVAGAGVNEVTDVAVQEDGKILVAGKFHSPRAFLLRFQPDGTVDGSFTVTPDAAVRALGIQADWSIVLGGEFTSLVTADRPGGAARSYLARVSNDGLLESWDPAPDAPVSAVVVQPDGKVVCGGSFTRLHAPDRQQVERWRLARITLGGAIDPLLAPDPDDLVEALALQPDGKILAGGTFTSAAGRARSMLARFYGYGTLDDDAANAGATLINDSGSAYVGGANMLRNADGTRILQGMFDQIWGEAETDFVMLNPDWGFAAGAPFNDPYPVAGAGTTGGVYSWTPLLDDRHILVTGLGVYRDYSLEPGLTIAMDGSVDDQTPFARNWGTASSGIIVSADVTSASVEAPDGTIYLAGVLYPHAASFARSQWGAPVYLAKIGADGVWDETFTVPDALMLPDLSPNMDPSLADYLNPAITALLLEPGPTKDQYKLIVGTKYGNIFRLNNDGTLDTTFKVLKADPRYDSIPPPWFPELGATWEPFEQHVNSLSFDRDGQIVAGGSFSFPITNNGTTWNRNLVRLNRNRPGYQDGTLDDTFTVATTLSSLYDDYRGFSPNEIKTVALRTDGSMVVAGFFDSVTGADGAPFEVADVARIGAGGKLDQSLVLGAFQPSMDGREANAVYGASLDPDGKIVVIGEFTSIGGDSSKTALVRFSGGWATQELTVAADGGAVRWVRGGASPELKRALFYYSEDGANWTLLGEGSRVSAEKWELSGLHLGKDKGWNVTRYVRARGLMAGDNGGGQFLETVRAYYLKAPVTVQPASVSSTVGTIPVFTPQYGYADGSGLPLVPVATSLRGAPLFSTLATAASGPGNYPVTVDLSNFSSWMYRFSGADGSLILNPGGGVITVTARPQSKFYGDDDPPLTYSCQPEPPSGVTFSGALTRASGGNVNGGPYAITQGTLALSGGYSINFVGDSLTIKPRPVTVTVQAASKTYGDPDPGFIHTVSPPLLAGDAFTGSLTRTAGDRVAGSPYAILQGTLANPNYTITFSGAVLAVKPRPVTVTAQAKSKPYRGADPPLTYTVNPSLQPGDTLTGGLTRSPGETVAGGPYAILQGTLANPDYRITYLGAPFTINPQPITVTADAKSKVYGTADSPLTYTVVPPLLNGDTLGGGLTRIAGENVAEGPYAILQGTLANSDYSITYVGASLSVTPKPVTVAADPQTKVYGAADPPLTWSCTPPPEAGDTFTGALTRQPGETVPGSPYAILPGTLTLGSNYRITFAPAPLAIAAAPLVVVADDVSRSAGTSNPPLTVHYLGLAPFDTPSSLGGAPSVASAADESSLAGGYPIVVVQGTLCSPNYRYSFQNGTLTVTGTLAQAITFPPMRPKTYGDADFDPGAFASSGLTVSYLSSNPAVAAVSGSRLRVLAPGTADITAMQPGDDRYQAAAPVTRALVVNPPPGNALDFDGIDDLVRIKDAPQLSFGGKEGFTLESWIYLDGAQSSGAALISKGSTGSGQGGAGFQLLLDGDRIAAEVWDGGRSVGPSAGLAGSTSLNDGIWHHVALSVDTGTGDAALYLDGRVEAELPGAVLGIVPDNPDDLLLGVDRTGSIFFKGAMDEVRIWDLPLGIDRLRGEASQIIDPAGDQHLAAYYHFDEGDAGLDNRAFLTLPDRTSYGGDGTLQGFALSGPHSNWIRSDAFLPLLDSTPLTGITATSATGGGTIFPNYYPATDAGLCWGSAPYPGLAGRCLHLTEAATPFTATLTGLVPGSDYHVRSFGINTMGITYGNDVAMRAPRIDQTISIPPLPPKSYGDTSFSPGGTATSGLPLGYTSSDPSVAIVVEGEIVITGAGTTLITASQGGSGTYNPAPPVTIPFTVAKAVITVTAADCGRAYQTPNPPLTARFGRLVGSDSMAVISGAPLLATSATLASPAGGYPVTVDVTPLSAANYRFVGASGTLTVFRSCQEIFFPPLPERTYGDPPFTVTAAACSGLTLVFTSSDPGLARVDGNVVTINGAGSVVITASQGGSDSLEKATDVSQPLVVHKKGQRIMWGPLPEAVAGGLPVELAATASSSLPISYRSSDPAVATVSGDRATPAGGGIAVITATQTGDANYEAALPVSQPLVVAQEGNPPAVAISALTSGSVTTDPTLNVTASVGDCSEVSSVTVNGSGVTGRDGIYSAALPLVRGENGVTVAATDGEGNRATRTLSVTLDPGAPVLSLREPSDNAVTGQEKVQVTGTVVLGASATMTVNGSRVALVVSGDSLEGSGILQEGINTVEVAATLAGKSSRLKRTVILSPGRPRIAITDPAEDLQEEGDFVVVKGRAGSEAGGVTVAIEAGGSLLLPTVGADGGFQQRLPLAPDGVTRITATATDAAGGVSRTFRNVLRPLVIKGDVNGDGVVDLADVLAAMRIALGLDPAAPQALGRGDVAPLAGGVPAPDGRIDVGDVTVILQKLVGVLDF